MGAKTEFGSMLREARRYKHWTQKKLAQRVWVSPSYINKIERGERVRLYADFVGLLADVLDLQGEYRVKFFEAAHNTKLLEPGDQQENEKWLNRLNRSWRDLPIKWQRELRLGIERFFEGKRIYF